MPRAWWTWPFPWWPGAADDDAPEPDVEHPDVLAAVVAKLNGSPALRANGWTFWADEAPPRTPIPFGVATEAEPVGTAYTTGAPYRETTVVEVGLRHPSAKELLEWPAWGRIADAALEDAELRVEGGVRMAVLKDGRETDLDAEKGPAGLDLYVLPLRYRCVYSRTLG